MEATVCDSCRKPILQGASAHVEVRVYDGPGSYGGSIEDIDLCLECIPKANALIAEQIKQEMSPPPTPIRPKPKRST